MEKELHKSDFVFGSVLSPSIELRRNAVKQAKQRPTKYTNPFISLLKIDPNAKIHTKIKGDNRKNKYINEPKFISMVTMDFVLYYRHINNPFVVYASEKKI